MEAAGFLQGQDALHPSVACEAGGPVGPFAPQPSEAQGPFGPIIRGIDPMLGEEDPQRVHRAEEATGKRPRVILTIRILLNPRTQPRVPGAPCATGGGCRRPMTEALQLRQRPGPAGGQGRGRALRHAPRRAAQVRQAGVPAGDPGVGDPVAVAHQEPLPILDERCQGCLRALRMDQGPCDRVTRHHPPPLQRVGEEPRGCITVMHGRLAGWRGHGAIMGLESLRHPGAQLLHGAKAERPLQPRGTTLWDDTAPRPMCARHLPQEGRAPRAIPCGRLRGDLGWVPGPTAGTPSLRQHQGLDRDLNGRQCDPLMRIGGRRDRKRGVTPPTPLGVDRVHSRGRQKGLAVPGMPQRPTRFAGCARCRTLARLLVGRVRRRRSVGSGGVLVETGRERCDSCGELPQVVLPGAEVRLDRRWSLLPVLLRKGKWPRRAIRDNGVIPSLARPGSCVPSYTFYSEKMDRCRAKNACEAGGKLSVRGMPPGERSGEPLSGTQVVPL